MRKTLFVLSILSFLAITSLEAQVRTGNLTRGPAVIKYEGQKVENERLTIAYEVPYDGMVEVRLFDDKGELIWQSQKINFRGENAIRMKTSAFEKGKPYQVQLNYKKDVFRKEIRL